MPPKNKVTRDDIIEAAFTLAKEEGFSAITARSVAKRLGCSTAPIYVNFTAIDDLVEAVVSRVFDVSQKLVAGQKGSDFFENVGKATITFAREYPVFQRELIMQPNLYQDSYETVENEILTMLAEDEVMRDWTPKERRVLLLKMRIFQTGLSVMVATGQIPSWLADEAIDALLLETGADLLQSQKIKREGKRQNG